MALLRFLTRLGLYETFFSEKEKEEFGNMDYSYENFEKIKNIKFTEYINICKEKGFSSEYISLFKDKFFIDYRLTFVSVLGINKNEFLESVKKYYIFDCFKEFYGQYRNKVIFQEAQQEAKDKYPEFKEEFKKGFLNKIYYWFCDNDSNDERIKVLYENYYKKKKNDYLNLNTDDNDDTDNV